MQVKLRFLILFLCCFVNYFCKSENNFVNLVKSDSVIAIETIIENQNVSRPNPILQLFKRKQKKNKKLIATALAFPFPFGMVGLHRIYLGTAPYIPVVYIGTVGGGFGILPFIDFCILILDKDFERYNNNNKVFMWVNDEEKKQKK
jgi:TM2 domain-containing membrane protein YozV